MINRCSHLIGLELHQLPSIGTKFMSPYLQVSGECTQIIFLNLSTKVLELFIDVALRKTAQIIKTSNIFRCQWYKLDWFSCEFIGKIQLTWGRSCHSNTIKLIVISSSSFFMCLTGYVCAYVHVHLDLPCEIPKSDLLSGKKLFQAILVPRNHSERHLPMTIDIN